MNKEEKIFLSQYICNIEKEYEIDPKVFKYSQYGDIYKGKRRKDGLQVAIKFIKSRTLSEKMDEQKCFIREVFILANLNHPFCLKLVNFSFLPEPKIVTPFMPNGTLDDLLKSNDPTKFTPTEKMCSIYALCSTMDLLHQAGIIHRDLKPANIFITDDKDICIADFGSARKVQKNVDLTVSPLVTPLHAAPEAFFGEEYTNMIDVYSFGVIYYQYFNYDPQLSTGEKPTMAYVLYSKIQEGIRFERLSEMNDDQWDIYVTCTLANDSLRPAFHELAYKFETNESLWFENINREKFAQYIAKCKEINRNCIEKSELYKNVGNNMPQSQISLENSFVIPPQNPRHHTHMSSSSSSFHSSHKHYDDDDDDDTT